MLMNNEEIENVDISKLPEKSKLKSINFQTTPDDKMILDISYNWKDLIEVNIHIEGIYDETLKKLQYSKIKKNVIINGNDVSEIEIGEKLFSYYFDYIKKTIFNHMIGDKK